MACDCSSKREDRVVLTPYKESKPFRKELDTANYDHPLLIAAAENNLNRIVFLMVSDPSSTKFARDNCHNTVMHVAARHGSLEVFLHFMDREVDLIHVVNKFRNTVAHAAAEHDQIEILQAIHSRYSDLLFARNTLGACPAHLAAGSGQLAALQFLLDLDGSTLDQLDARGFSVADYAVRENRGNVVSWIRENHPAALQPRSMRSSPHSRRGLTDLQKSQAASPGD